MKNRFIGTMVSFLLILLLSGCSSKIDATQDNEEPSMTDVEISKEEQETTDIKTDMNTINSDLENEAKESNNILVVYFSRAENVIQDENLDAVSSASINLVDDKVVGNMKILAEYIQEKTSGELFSIQTVNLYSQDYDETTDQAKEEQNNNSRPELITHIDNMDDYDIVFLGYPNWWGTIPMAVSSFLEEYDFDNKTIVPFCSHEGSGLGRGPEDIASLCPTAIIMDGFAVRGSSVADSKSDIENWIDGLSLN